MLHTTRTTVALPSLLLMLFFVSNTLRSPCAAAEGESPPLVIAHRGACGYLPEHTLEAVALAHGLGADFIEQDIVLSKDHEPIVIHDDYLDDVTNVVQVFPKRNRKDGHYYVADFTLDELRQLSGHERTNPRSNRLTRPTRFPLTKIQFQIATLAEHIELIQGLNRSTGRNVGLLVELKDPSRFEAPGHDMSRIVVDTLASYGYKTRDDNAIVQTFDVAGLRRLREELHTDLRLYQLMNEQTLKLPADATSDQRAAALQDLATYADGIGPSVEMLLTPSRIPGDPPVTDLIRLAHDTGLKVFCYTLRTETVPPPFESFEEAVNTFTDAGIDGLITDFPDKVRVHLPAAVK